MLIRIITGSVLAVIAGLTIYFGDIPLLVLIMVTALLAAQEFYLMLFKNNYKPNVIIGYILAAVIIFSAFAKETTFIWQHPAMLLLVMSLLGFFIMELINKKLFFPKNNFFATFRVAIFIGVTFPFVILMRSASDGLINLFFCFFLTWTSDSCALIGGKLFGKHKLAAAISPKKTIEGSVAAFICTFLMGLLFVFIFQLDPYKYLPFSLLISLLGQLGDLHESLTKRFLKVKDSSNLLPGHGGVYDRGDSAIFVMPVLYYLINFFA